MRVSLLRPAAAPAAADVLESRWARLAAFLSAVHALRDGGGGAAPAGRGFSFEELHGAVEDACLARAAPALLARLRAALDARVGALLAPLAAGAADAPAASFLARLADAWAAHCGELALVKAAFLHLDRSYVIDLPERSLWDVGVALWGAALAARGDVLEKAVRSVCDLQRAERGGEAVDRGALAAVARMLLAVALFGGALAPPVLAATKDFYEAEGARQMNALDVSAYLLHAEARMQREVRGRARGREHTSPPRAL